MSASRHRTGILNDELSIGFLVWNRLSDMKDPETDERRSRPNPEDAGVVVEVPHLRVVDATLWNPVKARQATFDAAATPAADGSAFPSKQRPKGLASKLLRCGCCGGGYSRIGALTSAVRTRPPLRRP